MVQTLNRQAVVELSDPTLTKPLARFELLLNAVVGFVWGPLLFYFVHRIAAWDAATLAGCAAITLGMGFVGSRAPASYFRLRPWERAGRGQIYERRFGIRAFKRWMSHGDMMNAWLRRRVSSYRVVSPTRASAAAYAEWARRIERAHLAWFLGALGPTGYALLVGAYGFGALLTLANVFTNAWPVLLQRYNRVRAESAMHHRRTTGRNL